MVRARKGLAIGLAAVMTLGVGAGVADASVLSLDALREPLKGTKQKFELVYSGAGKFVLFSPDDGSDDTKVFWGGSGNRTFGWVYPCVDRDVTRWPGAIAESDGDTAFDPFVQKKTAVSGLDAEPSSGSAVPSVPTC